MSTPGPTVGRIVHYVARGSADGVFPPACRAAIVTEVGAYVDVEAKRAESFDRSEGRPIRLVEQWYYEDAVYLQVLNPTGTFIHGPMKYDGGRMVPSERDDGLGVGPSTDLCDGQEHRGGTWHWPAKA